MDNLLNCIFYLNNYLAQKIEAMINNRMKDIL